MRGPADVCRRYLRAVNMTRGQLARWSRNPCSRTASLSREPITRNLRLLGMRDCARWGLREARDARRTLSFIARHRAQRAGDRGTSGASGCPSRRDVALMNWGYRPGRRS